MKKKSTLEAILDKPVHLGELIQKLDFSEENIIPANREQPTLFLEASRYRVKRMRASIGAKTQLDTAQAQASMFLRARKKDSGFTEAYIKAKIVLRPDVIEAQEHLDRCQVYEEWAKLLLEAYRQRGHAIKTLAELLGAEASAQARIARKDLEIAGFESLKQAVRRKYPGKREED